MRTLRILPLLVVAAAACNLTDLTSSHPDVPEPREMFGHVAALDVEGEYQNGEICVAPESGGVQCLRLSSWDGGLREIDVPVPLVDLSIALDHGCGLDASGGAWCWGENWTGQLGDGTGRDSRLAAVRVLGEDGEPVVLSRLEVTAIGSCGVSLEAELLCWGQYAAPGCEFCSDLDSVATRVATGYPVERVEVAPSFMCVVDIAGDVHCWGSEYYGQLGGSSLDRAVDLPAPTVDLDASGSHVCAVLDDGRTWCWGENWSGQLGNGDTGFSDGPAPTRGDASLVSISAAQSATCGVDAAGVVYCWGADYDGRVRYDSKPIHVTPTRVRGLPPMRTVATTDAFACGIALDDVVLCWGGIDDD